MKALTLICFASLLRSSWCGLILHNIRDGLHTNIFGHGLHGQSQQNSPIININNEQNVQTSSISEHSPHNRPNNDPRGDYGSLPLDPGAHNGYDMNFKAGGSKYYHGQQHHGGYDGHATDLNSYGGHHHMGGAGGLRGDYGSGIFSHQMMKQENYKHREGPKFGYHHDTNIFGNIPHFSSSSTSSAASASSSSSAEGSSSAASSSSSSSSSTSSSKLKSGVGGRFRPWTRS